LIVDFVSKPRSRWRMGRSPIRLAFEMNLLLRFSKNAKPSRIGNRFLFGSCGLVVGWSEPPDAQTARPSDRSWWA